MRQRLRNEYQREQIGRWGRLVKLIKEVWWYTEANGKHIREDHYGRRHYATAAFHALRVSVFTCSTLITRPR